MQAVISSERSGSYRRDASNYRRTKRALGMDQHASSDGLEEVVGISIEMQITAE